MVLRFTGLGRISPWLAGNSDSTKPTDQGPRALHLTMPFPFSDNDYPAPTPEPGYEKILEQAARDFAAAFLIEANRLADEHGLSAAERVSIGIRPLKP